MGIREEILGHTGRNKFLCERKNISLREKKYFFAGENKFIYGRKFCDSREERKRITRSEKTVIQIQIIIFANK